MELCEDNNNNDDVLDMMLDINIEQNLIRTRRLILSGDITEYLALYINSHLQFFDHSKDPVYLYICSPGGDMDAGYSIIDQMELSSFPIHTIVRGQANSMAAIIATYGEKDYRYITKNSSMMMHSISMTTQSESIEPHKIAIDYHHRSYQRKIRDLSKRTLIDYKTLLSLMEQTHWMDAKDAIKIGVIDKIWLPKNELYVNNNDRNDNETRKS